MNRHRPALPQCTRASNRQCQQRANGCARTATGGVYAGQTHPLEPFFQQAVRNSYEGKLGLNDPDVTAYVAHLLCEFSEADNLYKVRDEIGRPIEELTEMVRGRRPGARHGGFVR